MYSRAAKNAPVRLTSMQRCHRSSDRSLIGVSSVSQIPWLTTSTEIAPRALCASANMRATSASDDMSPRTTAARPSDSRAIASTASLFVRHWSVTEYAGSVHASRRLAVANPMPPLAPDKKTWTRAAVAIEN
eukprot:Amastigsp_a1843_10.p3 type:complete len:132 gc:universal Amastigsp_a1843_10:465-860(+)